MGEWRKCSVCKKSISHGASYHNCSVSNCRKSVFCSVSCWDVHSGVMNHKSAGAEENIAPHEGEATETSAPRRILVKSSGTSPSITQSYPREILIVASKLKDYVRQKHELNTSSNVMEKLSDLVRILADNACDNAKAEGRKTLMDRDFQGL
jgi:hypothetical protein